MARIKSFHEETTNVTANPTEVDCVYRYGDVDGFGRLLTLTTSGSDERKLAAKPSQVMQFDRARAIELIETLRRAFPGV